MKLSNSDKEVLLAAINRRGSRSGVVLASSLDKKRLYNAAVKLAKMGLIDNVKITYQYCDGEGWNDFSGTLNSEGFRVAHTIC